MTCESEFHNHIGEGWHSGRRVAFPATKNQMATDLSLENLMTRETFEIAIVGAGPGGISMAVEARYADIPSDEILILEKGEHHSWAISHHYPDDKMVVQNYKGYDVMPEGALGIGDLTKHDTLSYLERAIAEHKLRINYGETVTVVKRLDDGGISVQTDRGSYRARNCVIAIGILEKPNSPDYPLPRSLKPRIHHDISPEILEDEEFLVVGGGDTAYERASYLCRLRKRVTLSYRGSEFARLNEIYRQNLMDFERNGNMTILRSSNVVKVENKKGRPQVVFGEEEYGVRAFDHIIYCLGGATPHGFLKAAGIEFAGRMPVINDGYETNVAGLFLIGDLSAGLKGGSVNWAFNSSHAAMRKICDRKLARSPRRPGTPRASSA